MIHDTRSSSRHSRLPCGATTRHSSDWASEDENWCSSGRSADAEDEEDEDEDEDEEDADVGEGEHAAGGEDDDASAAAAVAPALGEASPDEEGDEDDGCGVLGVCGSDEFRTVGPRESEE